MGKHLTKLQYLNVSFCKFVSDDGLLTLIEQIPALIKLDFQNTSISNRTKQKIVHTLNSRRLYNITLDWLYSFELIKRVELLVNRLYYWI